MSSRNDIEDRDPPLTNEQQAKVNALSEAQIKAIDEAIWAAVVPEWRKMARIVGTAMTNLNDRVAGIPDIYYADRIRKLISSDRLEAQGDPSRMRYCEVRLPRAHRK